QPVVALQVRIEQRENRGRLRQRRRLVQVIAELLYQPCRAKAVLNLVGGEREPLDDFRLALRMGRPPGQAAIGAGEVDQDRLGITEDLRAVLQDRKLT